MDLSIPLELYLYDQLDTASLLLVFLLFITIPTTFLNQVQAAIGHAPGFLKLLWFTRWYVCVSAPEGINNQWPDMV